MPTMLLSQMTRERVTVALSGDGGDEVFFGGYHHYRRAKHWDLISRVPKSIRKMASHVLARIPYHPCQRMSEAMHCDHLGQYQRLVQAIMMSRRYPLFHLDELNRIAGCLPSNAAALRMEHLEQSAMRKATTLDFYSLLPDDFLVKVDRASMAHSLEVRVPLLDHRIVEFSRKVPFEILYHQCKHKYLLKEVLQKYVPAFLWDHPKKGFAIPLAKWFRTDLYDYLRDNLLDGDGLPYDLFGRDVVERIISDHMSVKSNNYRILWGLLSLALWRRKHVNG